MAPNGIITASVGALASFQGHPVFVCHEEVQDHLSHRTYSATYPEGLKKVFSDFWFGHHLLNKLFVFVLFLQYFHRVLSFRHKKTPHQFNFVTHCSIELGGAFNSCLAYFVCLNPLSTEQIKSDLEKIFTELYKLCLQWRDGSYQTIRSFNFFSALFSKRWTWVWRYAEAS